MSKSPQKAVLAILVVAFIVRIWRLDGMPPALHPDEMAGIAGVFDELQGRAPLRPFFDYRIFYLPLTGMGEYVSSLFFGYNAWAYRLPSVLYGLATIVCTIGLTYRLTKDRLASLCAGAVSAVLPWEITVSRLAWENASMLPYLLGGLWALRAGLEDRKARLIICAGALLAIDAYSYRAALPDAVLLGSALVATAPRRAQRSGRALLLAGLVFALMIAPLVVSVASYPSFFWRDAYISTFHNGVNAQTLGLFFGNYFGHFDPAALFFVGDGTHEHGPHFGVLYLWMVPMMIAGLVLAFQNYGNAVGAFLAFWLLAYPLGGAITNDGVPHFLRTLIGAPLAAILTGIGIAFFWRAVQGYRLGRTAAALFIALAFIGFSQFCQAYFIGYAADAAEAFQFENRDLFATVRSLSPTVRRICFDGLNDMNAKTLFSYYLRNIRAELRERIDPDCSDVHTLIVAKRGALVPPGARLLATIQDYVGVPKYSIFLTQ